MENHTTAARRKTYVSVSVHFDEYGRMTPLSIEWTDGRNFEIDEIEYFRWASFIMPEVPTSDASTASARSSRVSGTETSAGL